LPVREYRFHPQRRWRFDFAWPSRLVALEIDGGKWTRGRHQRPQGSQKDMEKLNNAILMGWRVIRATGDGDLVAAAEMVEKLLEMK
jgi:hypothetical protein